MLLKSSEIEADREIIKEMIQRATGAKFQTLEMAIKETDNEYFAL